MLISSNLWNTRLGQICPLPNVLHLLPKNQWNIPNKKERRVAWTMIVSIPSCNSHATHFFFGCFWSQQNSPASAWVSFSTSLASSARSFSWTAPQISRSVPERSSTSCELRGENCQPLKTRKPDLKGGNGSSYCKEELLSVPKSPVPKWQCWSQNSVSSLWTMVKQCDKGIYKLPYMGVSVTQTFVKKHETDCQWRQPKGEGKGVVLSGMEIISAGGAAHVTCVLLVRASSGPIVYEHVAPASNVDL